MASMTNAERLALSGRRGHYAGKLGLVEIGALVDRLLADIRLLEGPTRKGQSIQCATRVSAS